MLQQASLQSLEASLASLRGDVANKKTEIITLEQARHFPFHTRRGDTTKI